MTQKSRDNAENETLRAIKVLRARFYLLLNETKEYPS